MSADVVVGQADFTSNGINQGLGTGSCRADTLYSVGRALSDGKRLYVDDNGNHRVLIWNSIPTTNNVPADVVVGQPNFTTKTANYGGIGANTLNSPRQAWSDGNKLIIADGGNNRVLIYNSIPTTNNASADVVVGQTDFITSTGGTTQSTLNTPLDVFCDGKRLFVADRGNSRILIWNSLPTTNGAPADVVVGQPDFNTSTGGTTQNKLRGAAGVCSDGTHLLIGDVDNYRVLIYNPIPTTNNAPANVVIGQPDFISNSRNQGGGSNPLGAHTLSWVYGVWSDGKRIYIGDMNNRIPIYNSFPTTNNAPADIVIGQPNFTSGSANQGGSPRANTVSAGMYPFTDGKRLFVGDQNNHRVLIYNIGGPSIELGPQFEQGKAVLGKVFHDVNGNGIQDTYERINEPTNQRINEKGIEGVKVVSDTGIYAITDSDGKYHFPYIETGQHLLKVDPVTLPEGATFTTANPYKITVTKGILTKVSFGVKLPQELNELKQLNKPNEPLLKVSITQDPVMLKPRLAVSTTQDKENIIFKIDCNYFLFIEKSKLNIYNQDYKLIKSITLPQPIPSKYTLPISELPDIEKTYYYQLCVYDKHNREDRTGVGTFKAE